MSQDTPSAPQETTEAGTSSSSNSSSITGGQDASSRKERKKKGIVLRSLILMLEGFAVLFGLALLGLGLLAWKISQGPVSADFMLPHIQKALNNVQGKMEISIESLELDWHGWSSPIGLGARQMTLSNERGPFMDIRQADLDISLGDIVRNNIRFKKASIQGLSAKIEKRKDGTIHLFNEDETVYGPKLRTTPLTLQKVMTNLPPIYVLSIEDADISYRDQKTGYNQNFVDASFEIQQENLEFEQRDVTGFLKLSMHADQDKDNLTLDFFYDAAPSTMSLSWRVADTNLKRVCDYAGLNEYLAEKEIGIDIPARARGIISLSNEWSLIDASINAETLYGEISSPLLPEGVLGLSELNLGLLYMPETRELSLYESTFSLAGIAVTISGDMKLPGAEESKQARADFNLRIAELEMDRLDEIIPEALNEEPLYKWLVERISVGSIKNLDVQGDLMGVQRAIVVNNGDDSTAAQPLANNALLAEDTLSRFAMVGDERVALPIRKPDWSSIMSEDIDIDMMVNLNDLYLSVGAEDKEWIWDVGDVEAHFDFDNLKIDYKSPLMPVTGAMGKAHLQGKALDLDIDSAQLGGMKVVKGTLYLDDLITKGKGNAKIDVKLDTSVKDAFEFLSREPIDFDRHIQFDRHKVRGKADLDVVIEFPTIKDLPAEMVDIKVAGTIQDIYLPGVLKGLPISGGPFKIEATQHDYRMKGNGKLEGRNIDLDWHSYFSNDTKPAYESRIRATTVINDDFLDKMKVDISEFITGQMPVTIDLREEWSGRSVMDLKADLSQATLLIDPFDYKTPVGNKGRLSTKITLQNGKLRGLDGLMIDSDALKMQSGDFNFLHDGKGGEIRLEKADIQGLVFKENDFSVILQEEKNGVMKIALNGRQLDARQFLSPRNDENITAASVENSADSSKPFEIGLTLDRVLTSGNRSIQKVQAYLMGSSAKLLQIEVDAVTGQGTLYLRYKPNMEDQYSLRIEADDAGAMLKAFGITDKVTGGKITVAGLPLQTGYYGDVRGLVHMDNFNVRAAPALASLVKLMDLPTVMTSLNEKGLSFARLETEFEWRNREGGGVFNLSDGRTSGGSIGLTFAGEINKTLNTMAINGTIVPASTLNGFFASIPLVGEILSGGSGSIFAATYTMGGAADNPKTSVNPLSVLAPGILRRLLFEGGN